MNQPKDIRQARNQNSNRINQPKDHVEVLLTFKSFVLAIFTRRPKVQRWTEPIFYVVITNLTQLIQLLNFLEDH